MAQGILIAILFTGAVFYLGRLLYRAFRPSKAGCAGDCKCADAKVQVMPKL